MILRYAVGLAVWLRRTTDPTPALLDLVSGLQVDLRLLRARMAEVREQLAAMGPPTRRPASIAPSPVNLKAPCCGKAMSRRQRPRNDCRSTN